MTSLKKSVSATCGARATADISLHRFTIHSLPIAESGGPTPALLSDRMACHRASHQMATKGSAWPSSSCG